MLKFENKSHLLTTKRWILFFIIALFVSGITAFDPVFFLRPLLTFIPASSDSSTVGYWLHYVYRGLVQSAHQYPFLLYGYDWLAFAHLMIAVLFYGVYKNPQQNMWVVEFGIICCIAIIPFAFVCGSIRQIPILWQLIDCSFGVIGLIPLLIIKKNILRLQQIKQ
jgi:hypothetical protein